MTLLYIVLATLAGGVLSVLIAALLTVQVLGRVVKSLVSLSAGVLLGTALLHVLPEAFESGADAAGAVRHAAAAACCSSSCWKRPSCTATATTTRATATTTTTTSTPSRPAAAAGACWWATASTTSATA